jgi:hypothetical protein
MEQLRFLRAFIARIQLIDAFLVLAAILLFVFTLSPYATLFKSQSLLKSAQDEGPSHRKVVSVAQTVEESTGLAFKAVLLKTKFGMELEIYNQTEGPSPKLIDTFKFSAHTKGHFHVQGEPTQLVFMDADYNQILDLVASTYDPSLTPRLHVFRFDPDSKKFQPSPPTP